MEPWKIWLIVVAAPVLPACLLRHFGIGFTSKACSGVFYADCSLPSRREGKIKDISGCMQMDHFHGKFHIALQ